MNFAFCLFAVAAVSWQLPRPGQKVLCIVLNKFDMVSDGRSRSWGPPYTGNMAPQYTTELRDTRGLVRTGGMPRRRAEQILNGLDPNVPFASLINYAEAMAAITCIYWDEASSLAVHVCK